MKKLLYVKKSIAIVLTLALATAFVVQSVACGSSDKLSEPSSAFDYVVNEIGGFPALEESDDELLDSVLGIDVQKLASYELHFSSDKTFADEIGIFKLKQDAEDYRETLRSLLEARIERAALNAERYSPEQYEIILKSKVNEKGSFIFYVINKDSVSISSRLLSMLSD